ncbi:hypothetical protein AVEN_36471-1 [Araneus ventricosus]|uniref:Uncharacterized protein n=1 Tax=Araneus ventricosus TaxID=182803 RepID=A0A4Y2MKI3_ARAVE|nr:hypothetical protein AVEN_36471-1 [Araneus ventricosus]
MLLRQGHVWHCIHRNILEEPKQGRDRILLCPTGPTTNVQATSYRYQICPSLIVEVLWANDCASIEYRPWAIKSAPDSFCDYKTKIKQKLEKLEVYFHVLSHKDVLARFLNYMPMSCTIIPTDILNSHLFPTTWEAPLGQTLRTSIG